MNDKKVTIRYISLLLYSLLLFLASLSSEAYSEVIHLNIPIVSDTPNQHLYFHELLSTAIQDFGYTAELHVKKYPHLRIKQMLDSGEISIFWMIESVQRNKQFIPIEVGITNGLIGKRILFIKKGDQPLYDGVRTLGDFKNLNLTGAMGQGWFDEKIWKENGLKYKIHSGNWESIFKMIPMGREYNYFSRGIIEILIEAKQYPELDIERNLLFIYDRDFRFYLSKNGPNAGAKYKALLEKILKNAHDKGLIDQLIKKYWRNDLESLSYDDRVKISLKTPE